MSGSSRRLIAAIGTFVCVSASTLAQSSGDQQRGMQPSNQAADQTIREANDLVRRYVDIVRYVRDSNDIDIAEIKRRIGFAMVCKETVPDYQVDRKFENAISALSCPKELKFAKSRPEIGGVTYAFQTAPSSRVSSRIDLVFEAINSFPTLSLDMFFEVSWENACPPMRAFQDDIGWGYLFDERAMLPTPTRPPLPPSETADFVLAPLNGRRVSFHLREYTISNRASCVISILLSAGIFRH